MKASKNNKLTLALIIGYFLILYFSSSTETDYREKPAVVQTTASQD